MDFLIHHMLRTSARRFPDKEALVHRDSDSPTEVAQRVSGLAQGLRQAGRAGGTGSGSTWTPRSRRRSRFSASPRRAAYSYPSTACSSRSRSRTSRATAT